MRAISVPLVGAAAATIPCVIMAAGPRDQISAPAGTTTINLLT